MDTYESRPPSAPTTEGNPETALNMYFPRRSRYPHLLLAASLSDAIRSAIGSASPASAGTGAVCTLFIGSFMDKTPDAPYTLQLANANNGALAGLVSITAGCGNLCAYSAVIVGIIGGQQPTTLPDPKEPDRFIFKYQ